MQTMLSNYLRVALRHLTVNKAHSFINIAGLAVGMAVALLTGIWIVDEMSYDSWNKDYRHIVQVTQNVTDNGVVNTYRDLPFPLAEELRKNYGSHFQYVVMGSFTGDHILANGKKLITKNGAFFEAKAPDLMDLVLLEGSRQALEDPTTMLLSESAAKACFGSQDPLGRILRLDNKQEVKIGGVYKDLPGNSEFAGIEFLGAWQLMNADWQFDKMENPWRPNAFLIYARLTDGANIDQVSASIRDIKMHRVHPEELFHHPQLFLVPMSRWRLYGEYHNGKGTGGRIQYVWLFGIVGFFVLLLACINFMNLSTARSEKRSREVGIRKAIGSLRGQLIGQFLCESLLTTLLAFVLALLLTGLTLPYFNGLAGKTMQAPFDRPLFWVLGIAFVLVTGLIAGSYPAFYLSSFRPVKVLKGVFKAGPWAAIPRRVLTVTQFAVSVVLIIGTIVVFRQIEFARNRPLGYNLNGIVMLPMVTSDIHDHFDIVKGELLRSGAIQDMSEAGAYVTDIAYTSGGYQWRGKTPQQEGDFPSGGVGYGYGQTVDWRFIAGRDFSRQYATDSSAFVINETAANFMGLKNPVGEVVRWNGRPFTVIGVIKDPMVESPYAALRPYFIHLLDGPTAYVVVRLNPQRDPHEALARVETVFRKFNPSQPFDYHFADTEYNRKFGNEERIGSLACLLAGLAIFISCLGLFGMASFMAEQRIKEIGVRKVLGASVANLWALLSREFVVLISISLLIAIPLAWLLMQRWLENYPLHAGLRWWIFAVTGIAALLLTLLTVSYQAIRAALANPVKSLRSE